MKAAKTHAKVVMSNGSTPVSLFPRDIPMSHHKVLVKTLADVFRGETMDTHDDIIEGRGPV
jgi:hypothetical protein